MSLQKAPFFIVGTGRSGTTLFRNLLRVNPDIYIPRETHWMPILWNEFGCRQVAFEKIMKVVDRTYMAKGRTPLERILLEHKLNPNSFRQDFRDQFAHPNQVSIKEFQSRFYGLLARYQSRRLIGDKTPDYGFCMTTLRTLWPDARFIHVVRDGRDVALSMASVLSFRLLASLELTHWWAIALDRQYERGLPLAEQNIPIESFFQLWDRRFSRIQDERSRMPEQSLLEIRYETLLQVPQDVLRTVHEFLQLDGDHQWIEQAVSLIRRDNVNKNADRQEWKRLSYIFAQRLEELGFRP